MGKIHQKHITHFVLWFVSKRIHMYRMLRQKVFWSSRKRSCLVYDRQPIWGRIACGCRHLHGKHCFLFLPVFKKPTCVLLLLLKSMALFSLSAYLHLFPPPAPFCHHRPIGSLPVLEWISDAVPFEMQWCIWKTILQHTDETVQTIMCFLQLKSMFSETIISLVCVNIKQCISPPIFFKSHCRKWKKSCQTFQPEKTRHENCHVNVYFSC